MGHLVTLEKAARSHSRRSALDRGTIYKAVELPSSSPAPAVLCSTPLASAIEKQPPFCVDLSPVSSGQVFGATSQIDTTFLDVTGCSSRFSSPRPLVNEESVVRHAAEDISQVNESISLACGVLNADEDEQSDVHRSIYDVSSCSSESDTDSEAGDSDKEGYTPSSDGDSDYSGAPESEQESTSVEMLTDSTQLPSVGAAEVQVR